MDAETETPMAIFGWPSDVSACGWYRMFLPLRQLARKYGCSVEVDAENSRPFTVVVAQRTAKPRTSILLDRLKASTLTYRGSRIPKVVYELDDDFWSISKNNPAYENYAPGSETMRLMEANVRKADLVTVSTDALASRISQFNENVVVLPNSIPDRLTNENAYPYEIIGGRPFVLFWQGSATHRDDFLQAAPGISSFMRANADVRIVFLGTDYSSLLHASLKSRCSFQGWIESIPKYYDFIASLGISVALAPLIPSAFNDSKSAIRTIEMNALGIPVVASNCNPYRASIIHGETGLLVSPSEWHSALESLVDVDRRVKLSTSSRQRSKAFTISANVSKWYDAYREVLAA